MKNKLITALPCITLLILFTIVQFSNLNSGYSEFLKSCGLIYEDKDNNDSKINLQNNQNILEGQELKEDGQTQEEQSEIEQKMKLHARAALLLDASNNRVLYEKKGYDEMPMASTTKIMTCIVALENSKPDEVVTVSAYASKMPDVQLNIKPGEKFYLGDLLYSLMLESHNDVAVAIAEQIGGSVEGFATMMNDKARALGCEHTNFVTPNGLDANGHYTTARDLAVIASYAIKNPKFIEITNTSSHVFKEITKGRSFQVSNKNRFLYMMEGAIGVKTGFTNDAGYCFVGAIKKPDRTLISVVLGCGWPPSKSLKWSDTKELMNYGISSYRERQIFQDVKLNPVFVNNGRQRYETLSMKGNITLLMRADEKVKIEYDIPKMLQAPVKANSIVGNAKYYINDIYYDSIPIYAALDISKIDLKFCINKILQLWSQRY